MLALFNFIAIGLLLLAVLSNRTSPLVTLNAIAKFGAASVPVGLASHLLFALGLIAVVEPAIRLRHSLLQRVARSCQSMQYAARAIGAACTGQPVRDVEFHGLRRSGIGLFPI